MASRRFGAFYSRSFETRPWVTLAVANGTLGALADTLAQTLERYQRPQISKAALSSLDPSQQSSPSTIASPKAATALAQYGDRRESWDFYRTGRFFAFGVMMAPLLAQWNRFIEFGFPLRTIGSAGQGKVSLAALAKRVGVDQLGFAPFGLACFVGAMGFMEGRDTQGVQLKFQEMFLPALIANWKLWPAVQTINFRFMPLRYRVPFTGAIGIAWQVFLSILNAAERKIDAKPTPVSA